MSEADQLLSRVTAMKKQLKEFRIIGGEGVTVHGSMEHGYAVSVEGGGGAEGGAGGGGGGGGTPTGACCIGPDCHILTSDDCATMGGIYQGDSVPCDPNPCSVCPTCTAHVHIEFSIDFDGPCNVSTSEDHSVAVAWTDCDFSTSSEKFDLLIPLSSAADTPSGCFADLASAYYEIFAFYDTGTGWTFTFKIHLGAGSFDTGPPDPGFGNLDTLGTLSQTAYGGTSSVYFTCS